MILVKGHALGNDYLVVHEGNPIGPDHVRRLCDRHRGIGGDGVLEIIPSAQADFGVRIWNPDGSKAEKSGNGLRILARYLVTRRAAAPTFTVETASGVVRCEVDGDRITVDMGTATFDPEKIPTTVRLFDTPIEVDGAEVRVTAVGMGNPHCVSFHDKPLSILPVRSWGAFLERAPYFPNRTNVQFARVVNPRTIEVRVWERGVGETSASGSSACAVAAAAAQQGLTDRDVRIKMPGGELSVQVAADLAVRLTGPAVEVALIEPSGELLEALS